MSLPKNVDIISGKELFQRVLSDAVGNVIYYGIACLIIWWVGSNLRWLGLFLFAIYALIEAWSLVHFIFTIGLGLIATPLILYEAWKRRSASFRKELNDQILTALAQITRIVEQCFHVAYFLFLYRLFFMRG